MTTKASKRKVTIVCKPHEAYLIERALARYCGLAQDTAPTMAITVSDMAYQLQHALVEKAGMPVSDFRGKP